MAAAVSVLMGSDSDWAVMERCVGQLREFGIEAEVQVLSAHRTPAKLPEYVRGAGDRGVRVFIAAAGMAAHLAGAVAAHTSLPVIGVPIDAGPLKGVDALLSTVQMPPGVPVATVGIGAAGAKNAAILAAQILALADPNLTDALQNSKSKQAESVDRKNQILQEKLQRG